MASRFAVQETYESMIEYEKHMFRFRKNHKLERTMNSQEFEMYQTEFGIKKDNENEDKNKIKLNCIVRCFQVDALKWKISGGNSFHSKPTSPSKLSHMQSKSRMLWM